MNNNNNNNNNNNHKKKKKENLQNFGFCCPNWLESKIERKWKKGYVPRPCLGIQKTVEHESGDKTNSN